MTAAAFSLKVTGDEREPAMVSVTGEVDATNAAQFDAALGEIAARCSTVLDLSDLLYMDSAGFAALHRLLAEHPRLAIALSVHSPLRKAAALMDLPYHDSAETAAGAVAESTL